MIPKKIHQIWAGPDPFPLVFQNHVRSWEVMHPEWEYKRWGEEELASFEMQNRHLYDKAKERAPRDWLRWRADIARLEILYRYGGVYCDTDSEALKPLDGLLEGVECFFIQSPNDKKVATQALCGSAPGHPFIKHLLDTIEENAMSFRSGARLVETVGPQFITRELRKLKPKDVAVFDADLFSGQSIRERDRGLVPKLSRAYVNHKYNNTDRLRNSGAKQAGAWREIADILNGSGTSEIAFWLTGQTMLGHVREGRCPGGGAGVELGIWEADRSRLSALLRSRRLQVIRDRPHLIRTSLNGAKVDFHIHRVDPETDEVWYEEHRRQERKEFRYSRELFSRMHKSIFYHKDVLIPSPPEEWCRIHFGDEWKTV